MLHLFWLLWFWVSRDPQHLLNSLLPHHLPNEICEFMVREDGLDVELPWLMAMLKNAPPLKFLCHQTVYEHREILAPLAAELLPARIATSVDEFIRWRILGLIKKTTFHIFFLTPKENSHFAESLQTHNISATSFQNGTMRPSCAIIFSHISYFLPPPERKVIFCGVVV